MEFLSTNVIIYILVAISLVLAILVLRLETRIKKLMRGKHAHSLEDEFADMQKTLDHLVHFKHDTDKKFQEAFNQLAQSVQGMHTVRFNAFRGLESGGDHSFATALVNKNGDGVILSTMHARDRVNVFSKPIEKFKSPLQLTEEEQEALTNAVKSCKL